MKAVRVDGLRASGTSYRGEIRTTYARLVEVFGEPEPGDGEKTQAEWTLEFEGTVATIYDWKELARPEHVTEWHIGGFPRTPAVELVRAAVEGTGK